MNIEVGTPIIYKGDMANASGNGVVFKVTKNANPPRVFSLGSGMTPIDTSASYDVVLGDGRVIRGVWPGSIGERSNGMCRFMLDPAGGNKADQIPALLANAAAVDAMNKAKAAAKAAAFNKAKDEARAAGVKLGLAPASEFKGRGTPAAANLRKELKAAGITVCSLRGDYNSVRVVLPADLDPALREKAAKIGAKYEAGSFDGMTDCYDYAPNAWGSVFGDLKYVFIELEWRTAEAA